MPNLPFELQQRVAQATVRIEREARKSNGEVVRWVAGQGILAPGEIILTAAHVLQHPDAPLQTERTPGCVAMLDYHEEVVTSDRRMKMRVCAIERIHDIAALAVVRDAGQESAVLFREYCKQTRPIVISTQERQPNSRIQAYVLTHDRRWESTLTLAREDPTLLDLEGILNIDHATSGGPIVDAQGALLGIVLNGTEWTTSSGSRLRLGGWTPRPHRALPVWLWEKIRVAQDQPA